MDVLVKNVKARGAQMTTKEIFSISTRKPRSWNDKETTIRGKLFK